MLFPTCSDTIKSGGNIGFSTCFSISGTDKGEDREGKGEGEEGEERIEKEEEREERGREREGISPVERDGGILLFEKEGQRRKGGKYGAKKGKE